MQFPDVCGTGFAYHSGAMVNDNAAAGTAEECQAQCEASSSCKFWDFGGNVCRLRSNSGSGKVADSGSSYGTKNCKFGKKL